MRFTEKQLEDFKKIYKDKYWEELSDEDTLKYATSLMNFAKAWLGLDID